MNSLTREHDVDLFFFSHPPMTFVFLSEMYYVLKILYQN